MKYNLAGLALVLILTAAPSFAFESRSNERDARRLRIELEAMPSPVQQDFDRYVDELAAAARRDALNGQQTRQQDAARAREAKVLNPIALFRW